MVEFIFEHQVDGAKIVETKNLFSIFLIECSGLAWRKTECLLVCETWPIFVENCKTMTINLELPAALEHQLREEAAQRGVTLDSHISQRLAETNKPLTEAELLLRIKPDLGLAPETWSRYEQLVGQRRAEKLTVYEYNELIALNNIIEGANVERIKYLIELAKLRRTSLEQVMTDLDIRPRGFESEDEESH